MNPNPIIKLDCPDPDVIRVGDTYYMAATTMHFMPGCEILRSFDLIHWEHACYVYETLDGTPGQRLEEDKNIYGKGMWAASIRYHKGRFYVCFAANDTGRTYLYTADDIRGPWDKKTIEGFYHDCSLLFDDDGKVYIVYGNRDIWLTELKADLSGPLKGGMHRMIVSDEGNTILGYEGSHIYKIHGRYYLFLIHSRRDRWMRTQACYTAESLEGEFHGRDVLEDDMGYCGQGAAQGGIVDTGEGQWYAVLFQDYGAAGRIPILIPVRWENDFPVFGDHGKIPKNIETKSTRPGYVYRPLVGSDDFICRPDQNGEFHLNPRWQFNHEPDPDFYKVDGILGSYTLTASRRCADLLQAKNTITQRMRYPACAAEVTVNAADLSEGDYAGICALQGNYGMIAVTRKQGELWLVREKEKKAENPVSAAAEAEAASGSSGGQDAVLLGKTSVRLRVEAEFEQMKDEARFFYYDETRDIFVQMGKTHRLYFHLDHFTGCRFGLFLYATEQTGGRASFRDFVYE